MPVLLLATLDTKGTEAAFLRDRLSELGVDVRVVDTGCLGHPAITPDIPRNEFYGLGPTPLATLVADGDRGRAISAAAEAARSLATTELATGQLQGVIGIGGSAGTTIATSAMRSLPLGLPKLMVSTLASGQVRPWVGDSDLLMLNSVVDILGLNRISRSVLDSAARAMAGLVTLAPAPDSANDRRLVAASMFGVTTPCVERAKQRLEEAGFEVLVFHATGNGGQAMESLIDDGLIAGVLDITTTELADELVGGILSAGPDRLTAAGRHGVPQVVSVGATDMVNFGPRKDIPSQFADRLFYEHNPTVTLMRTTVEENRCLGQQIAQRAASATGPTTVILPLEGVSAIDHVGEPFDDPEARDALFTAIRDHHGETELLELPLHINDPEFADAASARLITLIDHQGSDR